MAAKKRSTRSRSRKLKPIPSGFRTVTPYLTISGASEAIEFYKKAFGAKELARQTMPDGKILHARLKIGDSIVMLFDEFPGSDVKSPPSLGGTTGTLHIYSRNVDRIWEQAVAAGAKIVTPWRINSGENGMEILLIRLVTDGRCRSRLR
jgi:PhnB protein